MLTSLQGRALCVTRDILPGEELTATYLDDGLTYLLRAAHFPSWSFRCDCALCRADRDDDHKTRYEIMTRVWPTINPGDQSAQMVILSRLEATYPTGRTIKPESARVLYYLASSAYNLMSRIKVSLCRAVPYALIQVLTSVLSTANWRYRQQVARCTSRQTGARSRPL